MRGLGPLETLPALCLPSPSKPSPVGRTGDTERGPAQTGRCVRRATPGRPGLRRPLCSPGVSSPPSDTPLTPTTSVPVVFARLGVPRFTESPRSLVSIASALVSTPPTSSTLVPSVLIPSTPVPSAPVPSTPVSSVPVSLFWVSPTPVSLPLVSSSSFVPLIRVSSSPVSVSLVPSPPVPPPPVFLFSSPSSLRPDASPTTRSSRGSVSLVFVPPVPEIPVSLP